MKICHVITRLILGGAQENTILTCEGLHARGHQVTLITGPPLGPEGELLTRARGGGYDVIVVDELPCVNTALCMCDLCRGSRREFGRDIFGNTLQQEIKQAKPFRLIP